MSAATANLVVMIVFGALLGAIMKLYMSIAGLGDVVNRGSGRDPRSFKERLADAVDRKRLRAENEARFKSMPRSGWLALVFIYGWVAVLVVVVRVSPVDMRWLPFLGSVLGAFMVADFVSSRARAAARQSADGAPPTSDR